MPQSTMNGLEPMTGCEGDDLGVLLTDAAMRPRIWLGEPRLLQSLPHGVPRVLDGIIALKGCAARTDEPASALDCDAAAKRIAMMPLWRSWWQSQNYA